jgi:glycosyltransferase involved in cell wall biosynthesis
MSDIQMNAKKERLRIGILFNFRKGWMGGIIYIINLVNALNFLDEEEKPEIIVFYNPDLTEFINQFKYPYLKLVSNSFPGFMKGYLFSSFQRKNIFVDRLINENKLDGVYPHNDWPVSGHNLLKKGTRVVAWIPDLQHKFYPHFFNRLRVFFREIRIKMLLRNTSDMVVSSHDVESHFRKFYKISSKLNIHVLRFVSIINDFSFKEIESLNLSYKIPTSYFIISNQFTNHKNHKVVLNALIRLKSQQTNVHIVCTGKMEFKGNEKYIQEIRDIISESDLNEKISLLGVIPRQDQLSLMKHARAIIQPSLFEGWSTVIEDAKTLQVPVIASSLPVNIEQLGDKGIFFDPHDHEKLAQLLATFDDNHKVTFERYDDRVKHFAHDFISIFDSN